jgi:hypothetical protein
MELPDQKIPMGLGGIKNFMPKRQKVVALILYKTTLS